MLEFIVLGQIPGTGLYISFMEFLALFSFTILIISLAVALQAQRFKSKHSQIVIEQQTI